MQKSWYHHHNECNLIQILAKMGTKLEGLGAEEWIAIMPSQGLDSMVWILVPAGPQPPVLRHNEAHRT
jgi:hypothetical protein